MQILVISDTHLTDPDKFPEELIEIAHVSDIIIHAGDFTSVEIFELLHGINRLEAVHGNSDEPTLRGHLPFKRIVEIDNVKIGLIHGNGTPFGMARRAAVEFENVNAVVFGHAHRPHKDTIGNVLVMNPGSPTNNRFQSNNTYGLLHVNGNSVTGEIIERPPKKDTR